MDNNNNYQEELQSIWDAQNKQEKPSLVNEEEIPVQDSVSAAPRSELEKMIDKLPAEDRVQFYKVVAQAGLREDDSLFTYLYIMGYINTMYKEIPEAINNASAAMASQGKVIEPMVKMVVEQEIKKLKREFQNQIESLISAQNNVSEAFKDGANDYLTAMQTAQKDLDDVMEQKRAVILEHTSEALKRQFPTIAKKYLQELVEETKKASSKNFVIVVSGVVVGSAIASILGKVFGGLF